MVQSIKSTKLINPQKWQKEGKIPSFIVGA